MHPRRLESRILKNISLANRDFDLLGEGDRILVALSGGKDSYAMLWGLLRLQASAAYNFSIVAYHLDQGQPGHDTSPIEAHIKELGVNYEIEYQDTYTRVVEKTEAGKVYCSLCSRFRRAILYGAAKRHGCNKVALGHHREDLNETLLLNLFFSGQIKTMPPKLVSDDGQMMVIRPLAYVPEIELIELSEQMNFPIVPCKLCGSQDSQRKAVKKLLADISEKHPRVATSILAAVGNVRRTHVLDKKINPIYSAQATAPHESVDLDEEDVDGCAITPVPENSDGLVQIGGLSLG